MYFFKNLFLIILVYGINGQTIQNNCSNDPRCKCQSISAVCARSGLTNIPKIKENFVVFDLRNNLISKINSGDFQYLRVLKTLYLNNNRLTSIDANTFYGLDQLKDLYLFGNAIERIHPQAFHNLKNLQALSLQQNRIKRIETGTFTNLVSLERLILNSNLITSFKEDLVKSLTKLRTLRLEDNRLMCDCDMFWLWQTVSSPQRSLTLNAVCYAPDELRNKRLESLSKKDLKCIEPIIVQVPNDVEISSNSLNSEAKFECKSIGYPTPTIRWFKNGRQLFSDKYLISDNGTVLIVKDVSENDIGSYDCVAKSGFGEASASASLKITHESIDELEFNQIDTSHDFSNIFIEDDGSIVDSNNFYQHSSFNDNEPSFLVMPNDITVTEGNTAIFVCRSNALSDKTSWLKDGKVISNERRFTINSNGDLEIRRTIVEDEGFYVCSIGNSQNIKYAQAKLTITIPVSIIKRPNDVNSVEGDYAEFYCKFSGKPEPIIVWKKDGVILKKQMNQTSKIFDYEFYQNGEFLRINNLNRTKHEGVYTCIGANLANKVTAAARLFVSPPVQPYFKITQQNVSVYENQLTTFECFAEGSPKPQVLWYKDGQRITTDSRVYFDSFGYLTFTQVRVTDAGEYLCRAENIAGSTVHKFRLSVKDIYGTVISNTIITEAVEKARKEVNKQFQNSLSRLNERRRPKTHSELMALIRFPKDSTLHLASSEEIYERALDIIFRYASNITFNLTSKEFETQDLLTHTQLRQISDLSGCFRYKRKVNCSQRCLNYRSFDGTCNNLENPRWGAANTALNRLVPAEYENGFSTPKGWNKSHLYNGHMLPNARDITTKLISTKKITNDDKFSLMLMQWGQFLDHDLGHTVMAMSLNRFSNGIACRDSCTNEQPCFPIEVLPNDTRREHIPGQCMEFVRSSAVCGSGETSLLGNKIHQREQINQLTAFIDASNVYGSSDQDGFDIRERVVNTGKLKVHTTPKYQKGFLPFNLDTPMDCQRDNTTTVGCFMAGDYRANEQLGLLAMHNLWVRHHNYMVDRIKKVNPNWLPEQVFQEVRKIVGAQMQFITYEQWLPHVLGPVGMKMLGKYKRYDPNVDPTISNEFATAAFRFGHSLIQPFTFRLNESFQPIPEGNLLLRDSFFAPQRFYYEGGIDPIMRGLFGHPAKLKMPREIMNSELTERLFYVTRIVSQDLAALNIQRGRDHGIPSYTSYRKVCNLREVNSFDDLRTEISSQEVRDILERLYGDVRNIDLFAGGILEDVVPGAKMGPTFMCIITRQFKALRDGDRFWYENPGQFSPAQLREIKRTNFAKIICENGDDIKQIQRDVFLNAKFPNEMLRCSDISDISLEPWRNCCETNPKGLCGEPAYFYVPIESSRYKRQRGRN